MYSNNRGDIINVCNNDYDYFLRKANVIGIALSYKVTGGYATTESCIQVLVESKVSEDKLNSKDIIDKTYKGIKTDVVEIGELKASALTSKVRPIIFGYSVGPYLPNMSLAGTAGCLVYGSKRYYILSNNHVLALENSLPINTPILQPANLDGGIYPTDRIATLSRFIKIQFETPTSSPINYVDAAIAIVTDPKQVTPLIYSFGKVRGVTSPVLNSSVKKAGRTTEVTTGTITSTNATVRVTYSGGKTALFKNQILSTAMSAPGDSGSLLLDSNNYAVGLLFAGSNTTTVYNPISTVLYNLNVTLVI